MAGIKKEGEKKKEQSVESVKSEVKKVEKIDTVFSKFPLLDKDMILSKCPLIAAHLKTTTWILFTS